MSNAAMRALIAGTTDSPFAVALYDGGSTYSVGYGLHGCKFPSDGHPCVAFQLNGDTTFYEVNPLSKDKLSEITTVDAPITSHYMAADSDKNVYVVDSNDEVTKLNSSGVAWGPDSFNVTGTFEEGQGVVTLLNQVYLWGTTTHTTNLYPFIFEVDRDDPTDNAVSGRVHFSYDQGGSTSNSDRQFVATDPVNGNLLWGWVQGASNSTIELVCFDKDETGTTRVWHKRDDITAISNEDDGVVYAKYDSFNDRFVVLIVASANTYLLGLDATTGSLDIDRYTTGIGLNLDDWDIDDRGNVYLLEGSSIHKLDSNFGAVWRLDLTLDADTYTNDGNLFWSNGRVIMTGTISATLNWGFVVGLLDSGNEAEFTFDDVSGGPSTMTFSTGTNDTWSAAGLSMLSGPTLEQNASQLSLTTGTADTTTTSPFSTELEAE